MGIIACYLYDQMVDWEVNFACHVISFRADDKGKQIVAVSKDGRDKTSCSGLRYTVQKSVGDIGGEERLEGLIIPGGYKHEDCPDLYELIRLLHARGKLLAAICAGTIFLARAGILQDVTYTTTLGQDLFTVEGLADPFPRQNYADKDLVRDKNVITAKYHAFLEFGAEIAAWLGLFKDREEKIQSLAVYKNVKI